MIPKIPKTHHAYKPVISLDEYEVFRGPDEAHERMVAGVEKYGNSWCEVNLKQDLIEELLDVVNYIIMIEFRCIFTNTEFSHETVRLLSLIRESVEYYISALRTYLDDFEGLTSAEWVEYMEREV
jgi:hypothetical protein